MQEKVLITGATGFIGKALTNALLQVGYAVAVTTRNPGKAQRILGDQVEVIPWNAQSAEEIAPVLEHTDVVVNLAGENLAGGKWSESMKSRIMQSRKEAGTALSEAFASARHKPRLFVQASAIGYYGFSETATFTENDLPGNGFLADVSRAWEEATKPIEDLGIRRVLLRTGVVLGQGGALPKMALPVKFFAGAVPGSGRQWLSWIHIKDEVRAIYFLIEHQVASGAFNLTAPHPLQMKPFMRALARVLKRPLWFRVPAGLIKAVMGEMAEATVLSGQKVLPQKLEEQGFTFLYPDLENALRDIYNKER